MELKLVEFETAKKLKDIGFNITTPLFYKEEKDKPATLVHPAIGGFFSTYSAPTQALVQVWLRKKHNIHISPWCNASGWAWELEKTCGTHISLMDIDGNVEGTEPESGMFRIYEQALEAGILESLKIIKDK